ncbi:sortase [Terrabacter sp. NPDC000476]|uniref:sortase domain-containing protein n=1 Tax=Terrabacter sp. NPDC000476 TaxID=3154258 RepID=UPI00331FD6F9
MPELTEPTPRRTTFRGAAGVAAAATVILLVVGVVALVLGLRGTSGPPQPAAAGVPTASTTTGPTQSTPTAQSTPTTESTTRTPGTQTSGPSASPGQGGTPAGGTPADGTGIGPFLEASALTSIEIPSIGVRSSDFVPLHVQGDGTISVPGTAQEVGLYDGGPTPGQLGPAVVAAHVDTPSGVPGIFAELRKVEVGDVVKVSRKDGTHLTFTVDRVQSYRKSSFPTEAVYKGDFTRSEIRLVTCGGPTDARNEYRDNVVVFGHLTSGA